MTDTKTDKEDNGELLILELLGCMDNNRKLSDMELIRLTSLVAKYQDQTAIKELENIVRWDKKIPEIYTYDGGRRWLQQNQHIIWTEWVKDRIKKLLEKYNA